MKKQEYIFSNKRVYYYFNESLLALDQYVDQEQTILIVDQKVNQYHGEKLKGWRKIVVKGCEASKSLTCFQQIIDELIRLEADRSTTLVGIGGGVITDLTGFVASVYMRGISCGFVPTTLLAQVDAAVGGKNGLNYDRYKNILGIIRQPDFLLFDYSLLASLDPTDLYNGFAEIIKYACIWDETLFEFLRQHNKKALSRDPETIDFLVRRSVEIKNQVVQKDEYEGGLRRLLNFGHTVGHAVEKIEQIPHGQAVAKGMLIAAQFSALLNNFPESHVEEIVRLIRAYHLPVTIKSKPEEIESLLKMDKKREQGIIHFIVLQQIGKAETVPLELEKLTGLLHKFIAQN